MAVVLPIYGDNGIRPYSAFNAKSYRLITAPAVEPVSLEDTKEFLRVDGSDEDAFITALIASARRMCEEYTKRSFITQTWELTQDRFSDSEVLGDDSACLAPCITEGERSIRLSREPLQSVSSIQYIVSPNASNALDASVYMVDTAGGRILLKDGQSWPGELRSQSAVIISYVAGYGDSADKVPSDICMAIKMMVSSLYESRGCGDMPDGVKAMLGPYQTLGCFGGW